MNYTQQDLQNLAKIISDPISWAEWLLRDPVSGEKFKANFVQKQILSRKERRVVLRVSRRTGKTISLTILALWAASVNKNYQVLIICPGDAHISELFEALRKYINATPEIKETVARDISSPNNQITFTNGSTIKGKTAGSSSSSDGVGLRGKGADLVLIDEAAYLKDGDFSAINPIIEGDKHRRSPVRTFAASTPKQDHNRFYQWCTEENNGWVQIHIPITENPDFTIEDIRSIKSLHTEREWALEYLCEFPDTGDNVFSPKDIDAAKTDYRYMDLNDPEIVRNYRRPSGARITFGVDWDTVQAGVNIAVLEAHVGVNKYREEVKKQFGEYIQLAAVSRIIALNELFNPDYIYVDQGYGQPQVEMLHKYGDENPNSGLKQKVIMVQFAQNIPIVDPVDGKKVNRQFKSLMLYYMCKAFESHIIQFDSEDKQFDKQLKEYKVIAAGANRISTTRRNEHIIDAVGLAMFGQMYHFDNPFKFEAAKEIVYVRPPKHIKSEKSIEREKEYFKEMNKVIHDKRVYNLYGRGNQSSKPFSRSSF
jgi:hypothetical protein